MGAGGSAPANGDAAGHKRGAPPDLELQPEKWFLHFDRFGKGGLDLTETVLALVETYPGSDPTLVRQKLSGAWAQHDKNLNGHLTLQEFLAPGGLREAMLREMPSPPDLQDHPALWFRHFDRNHDGLDQKEVTRALIQSFPSSDPHVVARHVEKAWLLFDRDRSGRIDIDEFLKKGGLRQVILQEARGGPPPDLEKQPGSWFKHFDPDCNGLDRSEVVTALLSTFHGSDRAVVEQYVNTVWANFDRDQTGRIEFREFIQEGGLREAVLEQMRAHKGAPPPDIRHHPALWFRHFDRHFNGLDQDEVVEALVETFPQADRTEMRENVRQLWRDFDPDRSGRIDLKEFLAKRGLRDAIITQLSNGPPPDIKYHPGLWFRHFDRDWNGLDQVEVCQALMVTFPGSDASDVQMHVAALWPRFDKDRSGRIDIKEFMAKEGLREEILRHSGPIRRTLPPRPVGPKPLHPQHPSHPEAHRSHIVRFDTDRGASHEDNQLEPLIQRHQRNNDRYAEDAEATRAMMTAAGLMVLPRLFGFGIAYLIFRWGDTEYYDKQLSFFNGISGTNWIYIFFAVVTFSVLTSSLNVYPVVLRARVGHYGVRPVNMYVYKVNQSFRSQALPYVLLEEQGDVGEFNRASRSLHHFVESAASVFLSAPCAGAIFPLPVLVLGILFVLGRITHQCNYSTSGHSLCGYLLAAAASSVMEMLVLYAALHVLGHV